MCFHKYQVISRYFRVPGTTISQSFQDLGRSYTKQVGSGNKRVQTKSKRSGTKLDAHAHTLRYQARVMYTLENPTFYTGKSEICRGVHYIS